MTTHLHTLTLDVPRSTRVFCDGCDTALRLATFDEANFIHNVGIDTFAPDVVVFNNNVVVVPLDFSLFQEA